jgi:hypothetical protein
LLAACAKIPTKPLRASPKLPHLKHPLLLFSAVQIPAFLRKLSSIEDLEIYLSVAWPEMLATPEEKGSLEFGTLVLGAKVLMVVGHENCGAVKAAIAGAPVPGQIGSLIEAIKPAVESSKNLPGDKVANAVKANIKFCKLSRLKESPVISQLILEG